MSYVPPLGNEVRAVFRGQAYLPPAPNNILAVFGAGGGEPVPVSRRVSAGASAGWGAGSRLAASSTIYHPATRSIEVARATRWSAAAARAHSVAPAWRRAVARDGQSASAAWGSFARPPRPSIWRLAWSGARPADNPLASAWGRYEASIDLRCRSAWGQAIPADLVKIGQWEGNRALAWRLVPYAFPAADSIQIEVIGGGLRARFPGSAAGYTPPLGAEIGAVFSGVPYTPPPALYPDTADIRLPFRRAFFTVGAPIEPRLDATGQPVIDTTAINTHRVIPWGDSRAADIRRAIPWARYARTLNPGWGVITPPGDPTPEPGEQIIIPIRRAYIVLNEVLLTRAADALPLDALDLRLAVDCDSWLPSWSASIPYKQRAAVMPSPTPVELIAYINGSVFRLLVERIASSRRFGSRMLDISGRGVAAELASPYAVERQHINAAPLTAQQLIGAALEYTDYEQDWQITDWPVPVGILSVSGTPVDVAQHVAEGVRAVLQAGWSERTLRMLPRYPVKPWAWADATPDIIIPAAVAETESIEWQDRPDYNVVYVSGQLAGVLGQVKITGTAGDKPAPSVTHPMITHVDAARQCGTAILGETGRSALMQISLPVLPNVGVIDVCKLIEFHDGTTTRRGITRANSVAVDFPVVRQTVTIEAAA